MAGTHGAVGVDGVGDEALVGLGVVDVEGFAIGGEGEAVGGGEVGDDGGEFAVYDVEDALIGKLFGGVFGAELEAVVGVGEIEAAVVGEDDVVRAVEVVAVVVIEVEGLFDGGVGVGGVFGEVDYVAGVLLRGDDGAVGGRGHAVGSGGGALGGAGGGSGRFGVGACGVVDEGGDVTVGGDGVDFVAFFVDEPEFAAAPHGAFGEDEGAGEDGGGGSGGDEVVEGWVEALDFESAGRGLRGGLAHGGSCCDKRYRCQEGGSEGEMAEAFGAGGVGCGAAGHSWAPRLRVGA